MATTPAPHASTSARPGPDEPTLGALVASASRDVSALVRDEIELAKTEVKDDVKHAAISAGMFGVAAFVGVLASILLSFGLAYGLDAAWLSTWLAFLVVGVVYLLLAGVLALVGVRQVKQVKAPTQAVESTKQTVAVLKGAGHRGARR